MVISFFELHIGFQKEDLQILELLLMVKPVTWGWEYVLRGCVAIAETDKRRHTNLQCYLLAEMLHHEALWQKSSITYRLHSIQRAASFPGPHNRWRTFNLAMTHQLSPPWITKQTKKKASHSGASHLTRKMQGPQQAASASGKKIAQEHPPSVPACTAQQKALLAKIRSCTELDPFQLCKLDAFNSNNVHSAQERRNVDRWTGSRTVLLRAS